MGDWEEFRTMFYRIRDDTTGCEPRKLFNVVEFLMHDKNYNGSIDLDECVTLLYARFGKEGGDKRVREMFGQSDTEKNISFSKFVAIQKRSSNLKDRNKAKAEADNEKQRRERERREFKEAQELESLRRAFKGLAYVTDPSMQHL